MEDTQSVTTTDNTEGSAVGVTSTGTIADPSTTTTVPTPTEVSEQFVSEQIVADTIMQQEPAVLPAKPETQVMPAVADNPLQIGAEFLIDVPLAGVPTKAFDPLPMFPLLFQSEKTILNNFQKPVIYPVKHLQRWCDMGMMDLTDSIQTDINTSVFENYLKGLADTDRGLYEIMFLIELRIVCPACVNGTYMLMPQRRNSFSRLYHGLLPDNKVVRYVRSMILTSGTGPIPDMCTKLNNLSKMKIKANYSASMAGVNLPLAAHVKGMILALKQYALHPITLPDFKFTTIIPYMGKGNIGSSQQARADVAICPKTAAMQQKGLIDGVLNTALSPIAGAMNMLGNVLGGGQQQQQQQQQQGGGFLSLAPPLGNASSNVTSGMPILDLLASMVSNIIPGSNQIINPIMQIAGEIGSMVQEVGTFAGIVRTPQVVTLDYAGITGYETAYLGFQGSHTIKMKMVLPAMVDAIVRVDYDELAFDTTQGTSLVGFLTDEEQIISFSSCPHQAANAVGNPWENLARAFRFEVLHFCGPDGTLPPDVKVTWEHNDLLPIIPLNQPVEEPVPFEEKDLIFRSYTVNDQVDYVGVIEPFAGVLMLPKAGLPVKSQHFMQKRWHRQANLVVAASENLGSKTWELNLSVQSYIRQIRPWALSHGMYKGFPTFRFKIISPVTNDGELLVYSSRADEKFDDPKVPSGIDFLSQGIHKGDVTYTPLWKTLKAFMFIGQVPQQTTTVTIQNLRFADTDARITIQVFVKYDSVQFFSPGKNSEGVPPNAPLAPFCYVFPNSRPDSASIAVKGFERFASRGLEQTEDQ